MQPVAIRVYASPSANCAGAASADWTPSSFTPRTSAWFDANNRFGNAGRGVQYNAAGELAAEYGGPAQTPGTRYLTTDHLGSTRLVTDASGNVLSRHDYLPFGEEIPAGVGGRTTAMGYTPNPALTQKFTGKERDAEAGLDYFGARYLSSAHGRFTTPDPLHGSAHLEDPQTWNRYSYAANNPLKYNDPAGLWNWDATAGGAYTDEVLEERRRNKYLTRRERNEAKNALTFRANFRAARDSAEAAAAASGDVSA